MKLATDLEQEATDRPRMKIMVAVKRVIDYAVKIRVKADKVKPSFLFQPYVT